MPRIACAHARHIPRLTRYPDAFMYVFGNAGTHETFHANRKELNKWKVIPRQLRDVTHRSIEVGRPFPIFTLLTVLPYPDALASER